MFDENFNKDKQNENSCSNIEGGEIWISGWVVLGIWRRKGGIQHAEVEYNEHDNYAKL